MPIPEELEFEELSDDPRGAIGLEPTALENVHVEVSVRVGQFSLNLQQLLNLKDGEVRTLDTLLDAPVDLLVNNAVVARGYLVALGDQFGVQISEPPKLKSSDK